MNTINKSEYPFNLIKAVFNDEMDVMGIPDILGSVEYCLYTLRDREREMIKLRFMEGKTLKEVGKPFNITGSRSSQIVLKALRKLRHPSRSMYLCKGVQEVIQTKVNDAKKFKKFIDNVNGIMSGSVLPENEDTLHQILQTTIEDLDLSVRPYNILKRANITTLEEIIKTIKDGKLTSVRNMGGKAAEELIGIITNMGLIKLTEAEEVNENIKGSSYLQKGTQKREGCNKDEL